MNISKLARGSEAYYLDAVAGGSEDLRPPGREVEGTWAGTGAEGLGLAGHVGPDDLRAVLAGADPRSGEVLGTHRERVRVAGFDLTLAAPKSASVLFALGSPEIASVVAAAHAAAVAAALGYVERCAARARRRQGGEVRTIPVRGLVGAAFLHRTSRAADPHLHTHVVVANLVEGADGSWSALHARGLYTHGLTTSYLYHSALRHELRVRLGARFTPVVNGVAQVAGIEEELLRAFSRRRREVEAAVASWGSSGRRAMRVAAVMTRAPKDRGASLEELRARWRDTAGNRAVPFILAAPSFFSTPPAPLTTLPDRTAGPSPLGEPRGSLGAEPSASDIEAALLGPGGTAWGGAFGRRSLLRAVCQAWPEGAPVEQVERVADGFARDAGVVSRSLGGRVGVWTTAREVASERRLLALAGPGAARVQGMVAEPGLAAMDALHGMSQALRREGQDVVALAGSDEHARMLEAGTGLRAVAPGDAGGADVVVAFPASGFAPTFLAELAGGPVGGSRLVLLDERSAWDRAGLMAGLRERGAVHCPPQAERAIASAVAEVGLPGDSAVVLATSAPRLREEMLQAWVRSVEAGAPATMVVQGRQLALEVNALARESLAERGLGGEVLRRDAAGELATGDTVLARWGTGRFGLGVGTTATVVGIDARRDALELRTQGEIGASVFVPIRSLEAGQVVAAWALDAPDARRLRPGRALVLGGRAASGLEPGGERCYFALWDRDEALLGRGPRQAVLARAAEVALPSYLEDAIGPCPASGAVRERWHRLSGEVMAYRERWDVRDRSGVLGPGPAAPSREQAMERRVLEIQLSAARGRRRELAREAPARAIGDAGRLPGPSLEL